MTFDIRNQYGFPIVDKLQQAQQYAADVRERRQQVCTCETCQQEDRLAGVIQLTEKWSKQ